VPDACARTCAAAPPPAKRAGAPCVEGERLEVGLGLLQVRLTSGSFPRVRRHQGPDGELSKRDRADQAFLGQLGGIHVDQIDQGRGIQQAARLRR
jgi:hypothetical protein